MPTLRAVAAAFAASLTLTTIAVPTAGAPARAATASSTAPAAGDVSQTRRERAGSVDRSTTTRAAAPTDSTAATPQRTPRTTSSASTSADDATAAPSPTDGARTATATGTGTAAGTVSAASLPGGMHALPAHRLLDTRTGLGAAKAAVAAGSSVSFPVTGREGVPATGVGAVALTVTVVSPTGPGFVTAYAAASPVPTASSLNYATGDVATNLVVTRLSADGRAELRVGGSGSTQLLAEVVGWVEAGDGTEPGAYSPLAPQRLLDTRDGTGAPKGILAGGSTVRLAVAGRGGVPAEGAGAVLLNVTAVGGTAAGFLTVAPTLTGDATTSNLNYNAGQVRANLVLVPLSDTGSVDLRVTSNGSVHAIADVVGWVRTGTPVADGSMAAVAPVRLLDTRTDGGGQVYNNGWAEIPVTGVAGVPYGGVHAVLLNVTATRATAQGRVSVLPGASNLPTGSQVQFTKGRNDANLVLAPVSADGWVDLLVQSSGSVDLVADIVGYVTGPTADVQPPGSVTGLTVTQPTKNSISLSWQNPTDGDLSGVTIRRVADGATTGDPFEGTVVAETTGTTFTDTNLAPGTTYGYSVWAHDSFPNISAPVEDSRATTALAWSAPVRVAPYVGAPRTISCVTTTWCMVGDASGQFLTWNGTAWSAPKRAVTLADTDTDGGFSSLSCVSSSFCAAVADSGGIVTYRSGVWSAVTRIKSTTGLELVAASVTCTSTTFCVAVGQDDSWKGWTARFNGRSWTAATKLTAPTGRLDCVSTTFCVAIGQDMYGAGWATRWNGSTWTSTKIQPNGSSTYDVSCTSATFCMATSSGGLSVRWNGSSWKTLPTFDSTNGFQGYDVSCSSTTFCITADYERGYSRWNGTTWSRVTAFGAPRGFTLSCVSTTCIGAESLGRYTRFNGTSWSTLTSFDATRGGIIDLACGATTNCLATDERGKAYRWNGTSWADPVTISSVASNAACASSTWCLTNASSARTWRSVSGSTWSANGAAPADLGDADCPVAGWCVAFDSFGHASTFNGTSWSAYKTVFTYNGGAPTAVDCLSKTFCIAVHGGSGYWSRWNGSTWSTQTDLASGTDRSAVVSCASTTMCLAVDEGGTSLRFDGTTWRRLVAPTDYQLEGAYDVACPTTSFCSALLNGGSVATFNGTAWNTAAQETGLYDVWDKPADRVYELECPSTYACVVAGRVKVVTSH